jgi:hypothetical protein
LGLQEPLGAFPQGVLEKNRHFLSILLKAACLCK